MTPAERRGAVVLILILLVGTLWDAWRSHSFTPRFSRPSAREVAAPDSGAHPPSLDGSASTPGSPARVDPNRATAAALDALPGIGPVLAARIVARREARGPYRQLEDLLDVPGIGPKLLARLEPWLALPQEPSPRLLHSAKRRVSGRADSSSEAHPASR